MPCIFSQVYEHLSLPIIHFLQRSVSPQPKLASMTLNACTMNKIYLQQLKSYFMVIGFSLNW